MANPLSFLTRLGPGARLGFVAAVLAIIGTAALLLWRAWYPHYERLDLQLEAGDTTAVAEALDAAGIPFQIDADHRGVLVPSGQVAAARAKLAVSGLPGGARVGFETFDQSSLGTTDFAQRINFLRALQGELERTVEHLLGQEGVRVHLTLPVSRGLLAEKRVAKAAVLVPVRTLAAAQVIAVQGLVAGAVEGLESAQVSVAAADGSLLSATLDADAAAVPNGASALKLKEEEQIRARVLDVLSPFAAPDAIRVAVAVELDLDDVERSSETQVPVEARKRAEDAQASQREQRRVKPGRIATLSVAVTVPGGAGLPDDADLLRIVAAAAGIRESRGDRLEVLRVAAMPAATPLPEAPEAPAPATVAAPAMVAPELPVDARAPWLKQVTALPLWTWPTTLLILLCGTGWIAFRLGRRRVLPVQHQQQTLARVQAWLQQDAARRLT